MLGIFYAFTISVAPYIYARPIYLPALFRIVPTNNLRVEARPVLAYKIGRPNSAVTDKSNSGKLSGKGFERTSRF